MFFAQQSFACCLLENSSAVVIARKAAMAARPSSSITISTANQANDYFDYFDIMILGKTGMGKTTTADKILMANPTGKEYEYSPPQQNGAAADDGAASGVSKSEDITMWHISEDPQEVERVTMRLKNLVFWRGVENPHDEVNKARKEESKSTERCELLSNDTSKVRVLDVPGFYGADAATASNVSERAQETARSDLSTMRKILRIQATKSFKFNRIVYFLPETGVPTRSSQILQTEISIMKKYFEQSIFESMIVVATHNQSAYRCFQKDAELYSQDEIETTRHCFKIALDKVFGNYDAPVPNIIFISMFDSCEEVLRKIQTCEVVKEGVTLSLSPSLCARCGIQIQMLEQKLREGDDVGADDVKQYSTCAYNPPNDSVPYMESTCHPVMIPKHSKVSCVMGGIAHIVTFKLFRGKWPDFDNQDEVCCACRGPPSVRGCIRVGGDYRGIPVDHTSEVQENFEVKIQEG